MARLHLSISDIINRLRIYNRSNVPGFIQKFGREYPVRCDLRLRDISDIRSIPLKKRVLLGDISHIHNGKAPRHYIIHADGVPAIAIIIRKQPGASTIKVVKEVDKRISDLRSVLPFGTKVKKFYDQSEIIQEARKEIIQDLILGAILAILILYFFLGSLRPTLIVAFTIPLTLIATISFMHLFGLGFNMITLSALALAVGMVVDDAIVVSENIFRHRETKPPIEASIDGAVEISGPDASGTFTTVAAFLPLIVVTGIAALFLRPFGITISSSLIISLILSLTLVPLLFSRIPELKKREFLGDKVIKFTNELLQRTLRFSFKHRLLIILLSFIFLSAIGLIAFFGRFSLLPPIDEGALLIEYVMPPGTSLKESDSIGDILERIALSDPDVSCVYRRTGSPEAGYQVEGVNRGELFIKLRPRNQRKRTAWEIMDSLREEYSKIPGCIFLYHQPTQEKIDESFSGLPSFFGVTIYGTDMNKLILLARKVEDILSSDPSISNVVNYTKIRSSQIDIRLNYRKIALYGLDPMDVLNSIKASFLGCEATSIIKEKEEIPVILRFYLGKRPAPKSIKDLPVGIVLPLRSIADISIKHIPSSITRLNGEREVTLIAEIEGNISKVIKRLRKKFRDLNLPKGYRIEFSGQYRVMMKTLKEMGFSLFWAVLFIYLIMLMQFGSWIQPLIILATIPLAMVGAVISLFLTRQGINVSAGMGAITLAGIAVNNAIVLVDYANRMKNRGINIEDALLSASSIRLRPIILTSLTTIFALIPAAIGTGTGSRIFQPFAIAVIGGLTSSMFATLIIVPTLICLISELS